MPRAPEVLVVDDEPSVGEALRGILEDEGYRVHVALSGEECLAHVERSTPDLVLLDVIMPGGMDGMAALDRLRRDRPGIGVVMVSGQGTIETAIRAINKGALDFIEKPLSLERVLSRVAQALEKQRLREENAALRSEVGARFEIVGESPAIRDILAVIERVAPTNARVLITGDSGTGKELVAWAIHRKSRRANRPFVRVNCAAIPTELIEAELFGYERGAFTGAAARHAGRFEQGDTGTVFLDEVGDMSPHTQAKVLRVLEEGQYERIGGKETLGVDVRVLAATNHNLHADIDAGRFREDLYYRLNVVPIALPPLRDRASDIALLAEHFLRRYATENGKPSMRFSDDALEALGAYAWPGNIRELRNVVERVVIMTPDDEIRVEDLPLDVRGASGVAAATAAAPHETEARTLRDAREGFEAQLIRQTLRECRWNVTEAARRLGVERSHLHRRMRQAKIRREE